MKKLLKKYIRGDATVKEKHDIILWLDKDPKNIQEYEVYRKLYTYLLWNVDKIGKKTEKIVYLRRILVETIKVAVVLFLGIIGGVHFFNHEDIKPEIQKLTVPVGQRAELTLSDGTTVWLNSKSTLKFPDRFNADSRSVELDGEGYFVVSHDSDCPFVVNIGEYNINVLGTEFNVKSYQNDGHFETSLVEGKIEVQGPGLGFGKELLPGTMLMKNEVGFISSFISDYNYFKWREGVFCFENESILSLIEKLQQYYDVVIKIEAKSLPDHRFSGKLRINDGIEHALKVLQLSHEFTYLRNDEQNVIQIK